VLYVHPSVPARNLRELVDWAKANPGRLQFGSSGMGSSPHISAELLAWAAGIDILHTPYRGSAPAMTDLIAGHINALFDSVTSMRFAREGRIRALGIAQPQRNAAPEVPTMAEQGFPGVMARTFYGFFAPPRCRPVAGPHRSGPARRRRSEAVQRAVRDDGLEPLAETPAEFAAYLAEQHAFWSRVVRERNLAP
jgi:tripartite-type tricarboxylate transporter receptor subunit TctC